MESQKQSAVYIPNLCKYFPNNYLVASCSELQEELKQYNYVILIHHYDLISYGGGVDFRKCLTFKLICVVVISSYFSILVQLLWPVTSQISEFYTNLLRRPRYAYVILGTSIWNRIKQKCFPNKTACLSKIAKR